MRKVILTFVAALSLLSVAEAQKVKTLPEDGDKLHLTIFGELPPFVDADPRLAKIKSESHYREIKKSDPVFSRYKKYVSTLPTVMLQAPNGYVIYESSGEAVPKSEAALVEEILSAIERHTTKLVPVITDPVVDAEPAVIPDAEPVVVPDTDPRQITFDWGEIVDAVSAFFQESNQKGGKVMGVNPWVVLGVAVAGVLIQRWTGQADTPAKKERRTFIGNAFKGVSRLLFGVPAPVEPTPEPKPEPIPGPIPGPTPKPEPAPEPDARVNDILELLLKLLEARLAAKGTDVPA